MVVLSIGKLVCHVLQVLQLFVVRVVVLVYSNMFGALIINFNKLVVSLWLLKQNFVTETETRKKKKFFGQKRNLSEKHLLPTQQKPSFHSKQVVR